MIIKTNNTARHNSQTKSVINIIYSGQSAEWPTRTPRSYFFLYSFRIRSEFWADDFSEGTSIVQRGHVVF